MITSPEKRLTAMEIMAHKWVKKAKPKGKKLSINFKKLKDWKSL